MVYLKARLKLKYPCKSSLPDILTGGVMNISYKCGGGINCYRKQSDHGQWTIAEKSFDLYKEEPEIAHYAHLFEPKLLVDSVKQIIKIDKELNLDKKLNNDIVIPTFSV